MTKMPSNLAERKASSFECPRPSFVSYPLIPTLQFAHGGPEGLRLLFCLFSLWLLTTALGSASPFFPVTEFILTNKLRVLVLEDHNAPLAAVQVWYHVGSSDETPERHGFAHLFEHLMFRGTDQLGPTDHFDLLHSV